MQVVLYPDYGQAVAVAQGAVDAATGFTNNEPVQLQLTGQQDDGTPRGPGHAPPRTGPHRRHEDDRRQGHALRAFVAATLRAMKDIMADPQKGLDAAIEAGPGARVAAGAADDDPQGDDRDVESPYTQAHGLGAIDPAAWQSSLTFMSSLPEHLVPNPVTVGQLIDTSLLPGS